jgi:hypothetical protein
MGFESPQPRKQTIDEILAALPRTTSPENDSSEHTIDDIVCKVFQTSPATWNVYQDGVLYAVTKQHDGGFLATMQSNLDLAPTALAAGKARAIALIASLE